VARASLSGNKGIEKSRKEGLLSQSPCKTDALFAPCNFRSSTGQMRRALQSTVFALSSLPRGSMKKDHVVDSTCSGTSQRRSVGDILYGRRGITSVLS